jgi:hypothetical protein
MMPVTKIILKSHHGLAKWENLDHFCYEFPLNPLRMVVVPIH